MRKFLIGVGVAALAVTPFAISNANAAPKPKQPIVALASVDSGHSQGVTALLSGYAPLNTLWPRNFNQSGNTWKTYEWRQTVEQSNDSLSNGFFFASSFYFNNGNECGGYSGLQTNVWNPYTSSWTGKGAVFSVFGADNAAVDPGSSNYAVSSSETCNGNNVSFMSIHIPNFSWVYGRQYWWSIQKEYINGAFTGYIHAYVQDTVTGGLIHAGWIHVPTSYTGFMNTTVEWQENYNGYPYSACNQIPLSKVLYITPDGMRRTSDNALFGESSYSTQGWYSTSGGATYTSCLNSTNQYLGNGSVREWIAGP